MSDATLRLNLASYELYGMHVPGHMHEGIITYIQHGVATGSFLLAVLRNDLREACGAADDINIRNIPAIVGFLWNHAPISCWGSADNIECWMAQHKKRREEGIKS